jgi:hypothetical protein
MSITAQTEFPMPAFRFSGSKLFERATSTIN